jgi:hypothetical protein
MVLIKMRRIYLCMILFALFAILLANSVFAETLEPVREQRLKYGPSLYILSVTTSPETIQPGSDAVISIKMSNVASYPLRDIMMELRLPSQFAPEDTSTKKIRLLNGLDSVEAVFDIIALPNSDEGVYKVPLMLSYIDEIGNSYSENNTISLRISSEPKIFAEVASSDIYEGNLLGKINIKIANTGVGDIKFLVAELLPSKQYDVIGSNKNYVGEIPSDDYETIDFKIKVNDVKNTQLLLKLDYSDSNNNEYTKTAEIPLKIISAKEAGIKQNNTNSIILFVIGILILYIIYRQIRKRLKKR